MARALTPTTRRILVALAAADGWVAWGALYRGPVRAGGTSLGCLHWDGLVERCDAGYGPHWRITEAGRKALEGEGDGVSVEAGGRYEALAQRIGAMVDRKQVQYGDSFHRSEAIVRVLWPNGIPVEAYADALAVIRVIDKLFRVAAGKQGDENPWADVAGYGLLGATPATGEVPS